jgi:hypothetical protein
VDGNLFVRKVHRDRFADDSASRRQLFDIVDGLQVAGFCEIEGPKEGGTNGLPGIVSVVVVVREIPSGAVPALFVDEVLARGTAGDTPEIRSIELQPPAVRLVDLLLPEGVLLERHLGPVLARESLANLSPLLFGFLRLLRKILSGGLLEHLLEAPRLFEVESCIVHRYRPTGSAR